MAQYSGYSYPVKDSRIGTNFAGRLVNDELINKIFTDSMLCRENIKTSPAGQTVVPVDILDYKANIPLFNLGSPKSKADALYVYNSLVNLTYWLLKVGTYSYSEHRKCSGVGVSQDNIWNDSGIALFTDEYTASNIGTRVINPTPADGGVVSTGLLTVDSLKQLATNCVNSWKTSTRPHYSNIYEFCHNSCHSNCHSSCHSDCHSNCHGFQCHGNGPGYDNAGHGGYKSD